MRVVTSLCDHGGSRALHTPSKMLHLAEPAPAKVGLAWSLHRFKQSDLGILQLSHCTNSMHSGPFC